MAIKPILRMGNPFLVRRAREVETTDFERLESLITDMMDTMEAADGAGLAAPQIGVDLRVVIFGIDSNPRYPDAGPIPLTVLINPVIEPLSDTMEAGWEGCLSVPGMRGRVTRYHSIHYSALDTEGTPIESDAHGFHARVIQHECDHLDGILYPQRLTDIGDFGYIEELEAAGRL